MRLAALLDENRIVVNVIVYPDDDLAPLSQKRMLKDNGATEMIFVDETTGEPFIGFAFANGVFDKPAPTIMKTNE